MNAHTPLLKPYGCPIGVDPQEWRRAIETRLNDLLDQSFALITALDLMEAECDLEPNGDDEPSLGWTANGGSALFTCDGDRELDNADYEPDCDDEDGHDAEYDPAEWGVADEDALHAIMH